MNINLITLELIELGQIVMWNWILVKIQIGQEVQLIV